MKTVKLTQDIPHEGLRSGDVLSVDDNSAASLVRRGVAEEFNPDAPGAADDTTNVVEVEATTYGDQENVRTIDDITDPQAARNRRVMSFTTVAAPDPGPVAATTAEAESSTPDVADADPGTTSTKAKRGRGSSLSSSTSTSPEMAAPAADAAGGDAGGGSTQ